MDLVTLLQFVHCKTPMDALHLALEATGGAVLVWQFLATLLPKATLWLVPFATRAAAGFALFLLGNPIAGPILRANKDKIVPLLRQVLDLINKVATAFEVELEKDIVAAPAAAAAPPLPAAQAPAPAPAATAAAAPAAPPPVADPNPAAKNGMPGT